MHVLNSRGQLFRGAVWTFSTERLDKPYQWPPVPARPPASGQLAAGERMPRSGHAIAAQTTEKTAEKQTCGDLTCDSV